MEKILFSVLWFIIAVISCSEVGAFVVDHQCTDITEIPTVWLQGVRNDLRIGYSHTSHGSQLITGITAFRGSEGSRYYFTSSDWGAEPVVFINDLWANEGAGDLGHNGDLSWVSATQTMLDSPGNDRNVVMWSWCGGVSDNTISGIDTYCNAMHQLEQRYPDVTFIYMTGHLDGGGADGNLHQMNERIRSYCRNHNKILFDFADIESYDPDGTVNYMQLMADDECNYNPTNGDSRNWARDWIDANSTSELTIAADNCEDCAHSQCLNCILKGRAFWWLMARIAGWEPGENPAPPVTTIYVSGNADCNGESPCYTTIGNAYQNSENGQEIKIASGVYAENLLLDRAVEIVLSGGYNDNYSQHSEAQSIISKNLTVNKGTAIIDQIVIGNLEQTLIQPADLKYVGAFRLPDSPATPDNVSWEWSNWSAAATSFPDGDPDGANDAYPGSLFAVGHDHTQYISEISIPIPVISLTKNVEELNRATTLQDFHDIRSDSYGYIEMPRVGLEYLPAQGAQTNNKLYFCWSEHLDEGNTGPTHGWCDLNLTSPQTKGIWRIGGRTNYITSDYIFTIPLAWANIYTPEYRLATGRYRDGGQDAQGPALFAYGPWNQGNPPLTDTTLTVTPLLLYDKILDPAPQNILNGYSHTDEWNGGAWLSANNRSAVIFIGNKGVGYTWYGCVDGQECPPNCECGESRGWWSDRIEAQIIFYDPADLAQVVQGTLRANQPQPYATMNLDPYLYHITSSREKYHISAVAFDRTHGLLYVFEPFADGDKPIVHVWQLPVENSTTQNLMNS